MSASYNPLVIGKVIRSDLPRILVIQGAIPMTLIYPAVAARPSDLA